MDERDARDFTTRLEKVEATLYNGGEHGLVTRVNIIDRTLYPDGKTGTLGMVKRFANLEEAAGALKSEFKELKFLLRVLIFAVIGDILVNAPKFLSLFGF